MKKPSANTDVENSKGIIIIIIIIIIIMIVIDGKMTGGLGSKRTSEDHLNNCIIKIGQNPEMSPGDLRRLVVTQTPVKDH